MRSLEIYEFSKKKYFASGIQKTLGAISYLEAKGAKRTRESKSLWAQNSTASAVPTLYPHKIVSFS